MKLMTYLGIVLTFSLPAKAVYIDGGIDCNTNAVSADAYTQLEFNEVYWGGWYASSTIVEIGGPSGSASGSGWGLEMAPAVAYAQIGTPSAGFYQFLAWHYIYSPYWGEWLLAHANTSCEVQGSGGGGGGNDPTPVITNISPGTWNAGESFLLVTITGTGFGIAPELSIGSSWVTLNWMNSPNDGTINANVSINPNAPSHSVPIQVISHGYTPGMGFQQPPGGQGPASPFSPVTVQAAQPCAVPTNFHQDSFSKVPDGTLSFVYRWASTSGNLSDLFTCRIGEFVAYPGQYSPYFPPHPPFPAGLAFTNPTTGEPVEVNGATGVSGDTQMTPGTFTLPIPLGSTSFEAQQYYYYRCSCSGNVNTQISGTITIRREVYTSMPSGLQGLFTVTKSGQSSDKVVP